MSGEDDDRGSALLGVMMFTGIAALVVATLVGRVVLEYHAVEDSLAQVRAYWAAMGFDAYALSRTMSAPACISGKCNQTDYSAPVGKYLQEIKDLQSWYYPDVSSSYVIQLSSTACQDKFAASSTASGEVVIKTALGGNAGGPPGAPGCPTPPAAGKAPPVCPAAAPPPPTTISALRSLAAMRNVELHFCLVGPGVTTCGAGPTGAGATQPQLITALHRPAC